MTTAIARCMVMSTATARTGSCRTSNQRSGTHRASVTRIASRTKSHRGAELTRLTMGHAAQPISTPIAVKVA